MEVRLVVEKGSSRTRMVRLPCEETIVGRRQDCDLRIPSAEVSRRHCVLSIQGDILTVEDLDSINGTFINGQRLVGKQMLHPGDRLEIGPVRFVVEYEMTQSTVDRLQQEAGVPEAVVDLDVLPLAEEDVDRAAFVFPDKDVALDALPLEEEADTELQPGNRAEEDDQPIPVAEELTDDAD